MTSKLLPFPLQSPPRCRPYPCPTSSSRPSLPAPSSRSAFPSERRVLNAGRGAYFAIDPRRWRGPSPPTMSVRAPRSTDRRCCSLHPLTSVPLSSTVCILQQQQKLKLFVCKGCKQAEVFSSVATVHSLRGTSRYVGCGAHMAIFCVETWGEN